MVFLLIPLASVLAAMTCIDTVCAFADNNTDTIDTQHSDFSVACEDLVSIRGKLISKCDLVCRPR
jgi:hypothetical protein